MKILISCWKISLVLVLVAPSLAFYLEDTGTDYRGNSPTAPSHPPQIGNSDSHLSLPVGDREVVGKTGATDYRQPESAAGISIIPRRISIRTPRFRSFGFHTRSSEALFKRGGSLDRLAEPEHRQGTNVAVPPAVSSD